MRSLINLLKKLNPLRLINAGSSSRVDLILPGLRIIYERTTGLDVPHEVHVIVPRAEIRKIYNPETGACELELIYSSLSIVDVPRHPLAAPPAPPEIPPRSGR